jgi:hypothetical protein
MNQWEVVEAEVVTVETTGALLLADDGVVLGASLLDASFLFTWMVASSLGGSLKGAVGAGPAQAKTATIGSAYFIRPAVI